MRSLIIEGASTAFGIGADRNKSWAAQLSADALKWNITNPRKRLHVVNKAIIGNTIIGVNRWAISRIQEASGSDDEQPVVILSVGQMEARTPPPQDQIIVNLQRFTVAMATFSEQIAINGTRPLYVGPQYVDETKTCPTETGWFARNSRINAYAEIIRGQAAQDDAPYVDAINILGSDTSYLAADGRHPNDAGHARLYEVGVRPALREVGIDLLATSSQQNHSSVQ